MLATDTKGPRRRRVSNALKSALVLLAVAMAMATPAHARPRAADVRVIRPLLRHLAQRGFVVRRVRPLDKRALLHPAHAKLPLDVAGSNIRGNVISIVKGKRRSIWLPTGANYPFSSLLHEAGHGLYERAKGGAFHPRPRRRPLEANHPMRVVETIVRELQANNMALHLMRTLGATSAQIAEYKKSRVNSFKSYLSLPRDVKKHPAYPQYRPLLRELWALPGWTRTHSITRDLPQVYELARLLEAS